MCNCSDRLIQSGFTPQNAKEICKCYASRLDHEGLESFTCSCEAYDPLKVKGGDKVGV